MGKPADFKTGSDLAAPKGTKKLARKCCGVDRTNWVNAPDPCCASSGRVCASLVSGAVRDSRQRGERFGIPRSLHDWSKSILQELQRYRLLLLYLALSMLISPRQSLLWFCNSIVRWNAPSPELNSMFQTILTAFKQHDASGWAAQVAAFPPIIQERLATRYGV